jgi:hypothetical protein
MKRQWLNRETTARSAYSTTRAGGPADVGQHHRLSSRACYLDGRFLAPARFRTSVGDMSIGLGRGWSLAMCVESRFVETCSPQNLQRALPGEMWTRCIHNQHEWLSTVRQGEWGRGSPQLARAGCTDVATRVAELEG